MFERAYPRSPSTHPTDSPTACAIRTTRWNPGRRDVPVRIRLSVSGAIPASRAMAACFIQLRSTASRRRLRQSVGGAMSIRPPFTFQHFARCLHERLGDSWNQRLEYAFQNLVLDVVIALLFRRFLPALSSVIGPCHQMCFVKRFPQRTCRPRETKPLLNEGVRVVRSDDGGDTEPRDGHS